jgi:hypothetical protein
MPIIETGTAVIIGLVGASLIPVYIGYSSRFISWVKSCWFEWNKRKICFMKNDNPIPFLALTRLVNTFSDKFIKERYSITYNINNETYIYTTMMPATMIEIQVKETPLHVYAIKDAFNSICGYNIYFEDEDAEVNQIHELLNEMFTGMKVKNSGDVFEIVPQEEEDNGAGVGNPADGEGDGEEDPLLPIPADGEGEGEGEGDGDKKND